MAGHLFFATLLAAAAQLSQAQGSASCNDACYSAIATVSPGYRALATCNNWYYSYPPGQTTTTSTLTIYSVTVYPTTYSTRTETTFELSPTASPSAAARLAFRQPIPRRSTPAKRQATTSPSPAPSTTAGLPLPNANISSACSNNPSAFASACSCLGDTGITRGQVVGTIINATTTTSTGTIECTSTLTSAACAAAATWGLQTRSIDFWDNHFSNPTAPNVTLIANATSPAACCAACFTSDQNCRYFVYTPPNDTNTAGSGPVTGGKCELNLEGSTCPRHVSPNDPNKEARYNWDNEGMYYTYAPGNMTSEWYGFGPCAVEVPYFYGPGTGGRNTVGSCSVSTAAQTITYKSG